MLNDYAYRVQQRSYAHRILRLTRRVETLLGRHNDVWISALINIGVTLLYYFGIPHQIHSFPRAAPFISVAVIEAVVIGLVLQEKYVSSQVLGYMLVVIQVVFLLWAVSALIYGMAIARLPMGGVEILAAGAQMWFANVLVFAIWYWRFDGGGPHLREAEEECEHISFLFPQMTLEDKLKVELRQKDWKPGIVDYLFLAFNTSTALSPADTAVIGRWAKLTTMIQASISLSIIVVAIGRSVNVM